MTLDWVQRNALAHAALPRDSALALFRAALAESALAGPLSASDLNHIGRTIGDAQIVTFGESSHGLHEVHRTGAQLFRYLVERKGVRVLCFETFWAIDEALAPYLACDTATLTSDERFYLNDAFDSPSTTMSVPPVRSSPACNTHQ